MFTVVYTFRTHPGQEAAFEESWAEVTREIRRTRGSYGSRLHREAGGSYVAIALWPDRATFDAPAAEPSPEGAAAREKMRAACAEIRTLHRLDLVADLWALPTSRVA